MNPRDNKEEISSSKETKQIGFEFSNLGMNVEIYVMGDCL